MYGMLTMCQTLWQRIHYLTESFGKLADVLGWLKKFIWAFPWNVTEKLEWPFCQLCKYCCCCSVAKSCLILCYPMSCSMPGFPVLHCLQEFAQTCVHWVSIGGSDDKEFACNAGDAGLITGSGRSPREENGNPLQYSCLENSMDRGTWWATVHGVTKSWIRLSDFTSLG